jgi:hypothetical protein
VDGHVGAQVVTKERLPRVLLHHAVLEIFKVGYEGEVLLARVLGPDGLGLVKELE